MQRPYEFDWWFSTMLWMVLYLNKRALSLHAILLRSTLRRVERSASSTHTAKKKQASKHRRIRWRCREFRIFAFSSICEPREIDSAARSQSFFSSSPSNTARGSPRSLISRYIRWRRRRTRTARNVFLFDFFTWSCCVRPKKLGCFFGARVVMTFFSSQFAFFSSRVLCCSRYFDFVLEVWLVQGARWNVMRGLQLSWTKRAKSPSCAVSLANTMARSDFDYTSFSLLIQLSWLKIKKSVLIFIAI